MSVPDMQRGEIAIKKLYISPGHNFFGHHGKAASTHEAVERQSIVCHAGHGIEGDRFFDFKPNYKGQITFFSWEIYQGLCAALKIHDKDPSVFRRNVITSGADLNSFIGTEFE